MSLVDIGLLKGECNQRQRKSVLKHILRFIEAHPEVINGKNNFDDCSAEDIDPGILGKFAD